MDITVRKFYIDIRLTFEFEKPESSILFHQPLQQYFQVLKLRTIFSNPSLFFALVYLFEISDIL